MAKKAPRIQPAADSTAGDPLDLAPLTEEQVRDQTDGGSFSRGRSYRRGDRIFDAVRRGATIEARCHGSSGGPYAVSATLAVAGSKIADENPVAIGCDCPRGGFCKHIVALLLTWIEAPERFAPRPGIDELLAGKSREELVAVLRMALREHPELESLLELPVPGAGSPAGPVDEIAVRREVARAFGEFGESGRGGWYGDDAWGAPGRAAAKLERLIGIGDGYADAEQWRNAVAVFATVAEKTVAHLEAIQDDEGSLTGIAVACDAGLARALDAQVGALDGDRLTAEDRERTIEVLYQIWETDIEIGGIDVAQEGPAAIARAGTPQEQGRVAGWLREMIAAGRGDEYSRSWTRRAAIDFLSMLAGEAGLSDEELLKEYREAELWEEAAESLVRLGRIEEGIGLAARRLTAAPVLLRFADRLVTMEDEGRTWQAIALIDGRLWEREGEQPHADQLYLAWLEERYAALGDGIKALELARRRFATAPTFATYEAVRRAAALPGQADGAWSEVRPELLALLRKRGEWGSLIDAHLAASEVAEAVALVGKVDRRSVVGPWGSAIPERGHAARVAAAAEEPLPEEAIKIYRSLAEREIDGRQRATYRQAATYLERVKALLVRAGRDREWCDSIAELRQRHKTLRALREELDALDLR